MKKYALLLALALAAGFAQAQTAPQVSVYGKVREYQESYKLGTADALTRLTNDTSRIGIRATADVGNGFTAAAIVETGFGSDAPGATTLGDRTTLFNLSNSLGTIGLGRDKHAVTRALDNFDALENTYGTIAPSIHAAQGSRLQNAIFVTTAPVMGLTGTYQINNSETANVSNVQAGSINYSNGVLSATVAKYDDSISSQSLIGGAKYTLAATKTTLYGIYSEDKVSGVSTTGKSIGVNQSVSPQLALLASYGENSNGTIGKAVGAAYAMSKALTLHARWSNIDAAGSATDVTQFGAGVEYNF
ncbi:MAG: porin [Opitutae bacterium]